MVDLDEDIALFYEDFAQTTVVEGKVDILTMEDETLELGDSGMNTRRVMKSADVERGDVIVVRGERKQVVSKTPYGDMQEEFLLHLSKPTVGQ